MKNLFLFFITFVVFLMTALNLKAQTNDWLKVESSNGEFSIEIPTKYNFFFDKDGFVIADSGFNSHYLTNMYMANAYTDKTLLSFEVYEADKTSLNVLYDKERQSGNASEVDHNGITIKQVIKSTADFYSVNWFFSSNKYIYVLTAASREGETATIKKFLDSLVFKPNTRAAHSQNAVLITSLKPARIDLITNGVKSYSYHKDKDNQPEDKTLKPIAVINKPKAFFVDIARMKGIDGVQKLRCIFAADSFIPRIEFINILPEGLARQALFALIRVKFLPLEKNGTPQDSERVVEYTFTLY